MLIHKSIRPYGSYVWEFTRMYEQNSRRERMLIRMRIRSYVWVFARANSRQERMLIRMRIRSYGSYVWAFARMLIRMSKFLMRANAHTYERSRSSRILALAVCTHLQCLRNIPYSRVMWLIDMWYDSPVCVTWFVWIYISAVSVQHTLFICATSHLCTWHDLFVRVWAIRVYLVLFSHLHAHISSACAT